MSINEVWPLKLGSATYGAGQVQAMSPFFASVAIPAKPLKLT